MPTRKAFALAALLMVFGCLIGALPAQAVTKTWNTIADGNWSDGTKWSPPGAPASGDDVVLPLITSGYTVTLDVDATVGLLTIGGVVSGGNTQTLRIPSRTLTLNGAATINGSGILSLSGGTLTGAGNVAVNGIFGWTSGTLNGAGTVNVAFSGHFNISGTGLKILGRAVNNPAGIVNFTGSGAGLSRVTGAAGGALNNGGSLDSQGGVNEFLNVPLNNPAPGFVHVLSGTLNVTATGAAIATGASDGTFETDAGALLNFTNGVYTINGGLFEGAGISRLSGGTLVIADNVSVGDNSGFTPGTFEITAGTLDGSAFFATETGSLLRWTGGTMRGAGTTGIASGARLAISSTNLKILNRAIDSSGLVTFTGSGAGLSRVTGGAGASFLNGVTFTSSGGLNEFLDVPFNNNGTLTVQNNQFNITATGAAVPTGTSGGNFNAPTGAVLAFTNGVHTVNGATFGGAGVSRLSGGTMSVAGASTVTGTLTLTGGTLGGGAGLTVNSGATLNWQSGALNGAGGFTIAGGAHLAISTTGLKTLSATTIDNAGTTTFTGTGAGTSRVIGNGAATFNNTGVLTSQSGLNEFLNVLFNNAGSVSVLGSQLSITATGPAVPTGSSTGAFVADAGAMLNFSNGVHTASGVTFDGSGLHRITGGTLSLAGNSTVNGTLELAGGTLGGAASLTVASGGRLNWTGGTITSGLTILPGGALDLNGTGLKTLSATTINNGGTTTFTGTAAGTSRVSGNGGATFNNTGTLNSGGGLNEFLNVLFNNNSFVVVQNNQLSVTGTGPAVATGTSDRGSFTVNAGATLAFPNGVHTLHGATFLGSGVTRFNGATLTVSGTVPSGNVSIASTVALSAGTLNGTANFGVGNGGRLNWTGGTMSGAGQTNVFGGGVLDISGATFHNLARIINNIAGTVTATGSGAGTNVIAATGAGASFTNTGSFSTPGGPVEFRGVPVTNAGTFNIGTAGAAGKINITNAATFTQTSAGTLRTDIGGLTAGTQFDRLNVAGNAVLAGTLNVRLVGGFTPTGGDSFKVINSGTRSGTFASLTGDAAQFTANYSTTGLTLAARAPASSIVTNTNDSGAGSLRAAITFANANPGTTIVFNIPLRLGTDIDAALPGGDAAADVFVIRPATPLPALAANGTILDGATQRAFGGNTNPAGPEIVLDGATAGAIGLTIGAANCTVQELNVQNFSDAGIGIGGAAATGNAVRACFIGTDARGVAARPNGSGVRIHGGAKNNTVGGTTSAARNVIAGNTLDGIGILELGTTNNLVQGNFIGLNAAGTAAMPNARDGIVIFAGAKNNTLGGTAAGAGNVLSGNTFSGISISGAGTTGNVVAGNFAGLNAAGTAAIPNALSGVTIFGGAQNNTVGGTAAGGRNVLSGNTFDGVAISGAGTTGNKVQGNLIGTNAAGTAAVGNLGRGITFFGGAQNNLIGGASAAARNVLSGNAFQGVGIIETGTSNNLVQGNFIGTNLAGTGPLPNGMSGVTLANGASNNTVGGLAAGDGNRIAFNVNNGVIVTSEDGTDPKGNTVRGNAIFGNTQLGINVRDFGEPNGLISPNDAGDVDTGPNNLQNFPVIDTFATSGGTITVTGHLNSLPNTNFALDFYRNDSPDPSGFGEGQTYVGAQTKMTNAAGNATFTFSAPATAAGQTIAVTATNLATGDTSEFSNAVPVAVRITPLSVTLAPGATQTFTATVTGAAPATVTWKVLEGASGGTITAAGLYTAPAFTHATPFHVVATSVADPTKSATALVTVSAAATSLFEWGYNEFGQLGLNNTTNRPTPQIVAAMTNARALAIGGGSHTVVARSDGTVAAWGYNGAGQLGDDTTTDRKLPVAASGLTNVTAVAAGWYHTLALKDDGTVWAWGYNAVGQLGLNDTTDRHTPVRVPGLTGIKAIAAGVYFSLALRNDGTVFAWGSNIYGQLGDGSRIDRHAPVVVRGLSNVAAIAAGGGHGLARLGDGTLRAWGWNFYGQLGDGTNTDHAAPVTVGGLAGATAIAGGYAHSLAATGGGGVRAWGNNAYGQLGDGTTTDRKLPVAVAGLSGARLVAAGGGHSLALLDTGALRAWGFNGFGQVGDGTNTDRKLPVRPGTLTGITAIGASYGHSLALGNGGGVAEAEPSE